MKITTDNHFGLVFRYFEVVALHVIDAINRSKFQNEEQFKGMLQDLLSSMAIDLDQYYIKDKQVGDRKFYPMICFRDHEDINESQEIVIPDGKDLFHEMMPYGVVDEVFEMREKKSGFAYGNECGEKDF
jgi:hypothetical protein